MHSRRGQLAPRLHLALWLTTALLVGMGPWMPAAEGDEIRLYVTVDKAELITLPGEPVTTVSVTNPKIADVQIITPNQILVNGKALGVTSLVVFYPRNRAQFFDLVVNPAPVVSPSAPVVNSAPHSVLVHRADRVTSHLFVRDTRERWVELGKVKLDIEDDKADGKKIAK